MRNIIVFTVNKAASMLLYELGKTITRRARMPYWSVNDDNFPEKGLLEDPNALDGKSGCFCPARYYFDVPNLDEWDVILHVRDPRDAITSMFFSLAYSHPPVPGKFNPTDEYRQGLIDKGIDDYAVRYVDKWVTRYQDYVDKVFGRPNTVFVTYEEMVTDFPSWLEKFLAPFPLKSPARLHKQLARKYRHNFDPRPEDVRHHKRQVTPGDHRRKLKPKTVAFLNDRFAPILETFGYEA